MLNSFVFVEVLSTGSGFEFPVPVKPVIDMGLLTVSVMSRLLISGVRPAGTRGTLKKPKTSRYSNSFGARFRDSIPVGGAAGWLAVGEERGCRDIKKSRSKAHRRISASILTEDGVDLSPSTAPACWYSPYSSSTRCNIVL